MLRLRPLGLCLLLVAAVACEPGDGSSAGEFLISSADEVKIGEGVAKEVEAEYKIVDPGDPLAKWAGQMAIALTAASAQFRDPNEFGGFKIAVIADDDLVNAFAAPGGYTYVSTGLLKQAQTCSEIAGIIGHEMGHVTARHGVRALEQSVLAASLAELILGKGDAEEIAVAAWSFLQNTQFSQAQEFEADGVGVQVSYNVGYNPFGIVDFFEFLLKEEAKQIVGMPDFLSSHPATQDRIDAIVKLIAKLYGDKVVAGKTQTYDCLGTDLKYDAVLGLVAARAYPIKAGTGTRPPKER